MTFFEQELEKLFAHDNVITNKRFVGNACYGRLSDSIRVKICFTTYGYAGHYEALNVTLLNRNEGVIDHMLLHFSDLWGIKRTNNPNFREGIAPRIWKDQGKAEWYVYRPTGEDYKQLADAVRTYVETFLEPVQGQQIG